VFVAPVIPVLNDGELEGIMERARGAGARDAEYTLIRLPREVGELFRDWLEAHYPLKAEHVMQRIRDARGGKVYASGFGTRMHGSGVFAELLARRFDLARSRLGYPGLETLDSALFEPPVEQAPQLALF
jgi:DNA repair photolyase